MRIRIKLTERIVTNAIVYLVALVGVVLFGLMTVYAADYTKKIRFGTANFDSVFWSAQYDSSDIWVVENTGWITSFPGSTNVTIKTTKKYRLEYGWSADDTITEWSFEDIGFVQGNQSVGAGTGTNDWTIFVMDTTGGDDTTAVSLATMTIRNMGGGFEAEQRSQTSGDFTFTVGLDSLTVRVSKSGTRINDGDLDTFLVAAHGQIDTTWVTFDGVVDPSTPGSPNLCNVWGYVFDAQQALVPYAKLRFRLSGDEVKDTCINTILSTKPKFAETDSLGYFLIALVQTNCINDAEWNVRVIKDDNLGEGIGQEHSFEIPADSTTYHLVF